MNQFTQDTQKILDTLKQVAAQTLVGEASRNENRKRLLGHYVVIWQDGRSVAIGEDAPMQSNPSPQDR